MTLDPKAVRFDDCPEGLFLFNGTLCFMSEYATTTPHGHRVRDAYVVSSGEYFWGGTSCVDKRGDLIVEPIEFDRIHSANAEPMVAVTDEMVERAWAGIVGRDIASACKQANIVRGDLRNALEAVLPAYLSAAPSGQAPLEGVKREAALDAFERLLTYGRRLEGAGTTFRLNEGGAFFFLSDIDANAIRSALLPASAEPVAWQLTEHQKTKLADFKACLEEYEGMRCESMTRRVREAAFDFALAVVLASPPASGEPLAMEGGE